MNSDKLKGYKKDLLQQQEVLKHQLAMLEGAIQYTDQLIEEALREEAPESAKDEGNQEITE